MKVSDIKIKDIVEYLGLTEGDYDSDFIEAIKVAAVNYISEYTGIPISSENEMVKSLDDYEDFYIVVMILCQDMNDNRTLYVEGKELNRTVMTILNMHRCNLIAK